MAVLDGSDSGKDSYGRYSSDEESSYGWRSPPLASTSSSPVKRAHRYGQAHPRRLLAAGVALIVLVTLWFSARPASPLKLWQPHPRRREGVSFFETGAGRSGRVAGVKEVSWGPGCSLGYRILTPALPMQLLTAQAPATSFHDSLRPDLRYLTSDSWSGLTGQFFTVLSLLHLAQLTQRVAIM
jgi:hypothetical protein